jgi:predicted MFS family arabinose efflux permease
MTPDGRTGAGPRAALPLVIAGFVISFVVVGGGIDTVSVFLNALSQATRWSRAQLSLAVSVGAVMAAVSTPIVGVLVDRFGVRLPMTAGVVLLAAGFGILTVMQQSWHFVAANVLLGPGFAACALLPITVAVTVRVPQRTALALGVVASGSSLGALVLAPAVQAVMQSLGWRGAYVALGAAVVLTPLPFLLFALPRGCLQGDVPSRGPSALAGPLAVELRRPGVAPLAVVTVLPGIVSFGISVHLVPYLVGLGHAGATAAAALGVTIGISAVGKIGGGFIGDRVGALNTLRLALVLDVVSLVVLRHAATLPTLGVFVALYGLALGAQIAVVPAIAASVFGAERFGTLFGLLQLAAMLAAAVGPVASGVIFDRTQGYGAAVALWVAVMSAAAAVAFAMHAPARPVAVSKREAVA